MGTLNPTPMKKPFWQFMINNDMNAWKARNMFDDAVKPSNFNESDPVWCFSRFGQTKTTLLDGRTVLIGGEHEDFYDPDFAIYNDVVVQQPPEDGKTENVIFGYPVEVFPPTDMHTTTLYKDAIYTIGGLGYKGQALRTQTDVYRLGLEDFSISKVPTYGDKKPPGGLSGHTATLVDQNGKAVISCLTYDENVESWARQNSVPTAVYHLELDGMVWF